jgi:hypothetical protein
MNNEDKRKLVKNVMNKIPESRVPVAFWWNFIPEEQRFSAYMDDKIYNKVIEGHKEMYNLLKPDLIKIMTGGFFSHPSIYENDIRTVDDLKKIKKISNDHPWIEKQIQLANDIYEISNGEVMIFYNIFSPIQQIRLNTEFLHSDITSFQDLVMNHIDKVIDATQIIIEDTKVLLNRLRNETKIDGVYYVVQSIQNPKADKTYHEKYIKPTDLALLNEINNLWEYNILHICGLAGYKNDVKFYKSYPAKVYNWAVHSDKFSLKEGKDFFNSAVMGGFDHTKDSILYGGSDSSIEEYIKEMILDAGENGLIIGADCAVPDDINIDRLKFVREVAKNFCKRSR